MSPDPLTTHALGADLNPYAYVGGHTLGSVDPTGLEAVPDGGWMTDYSGHPKGEWMVAISETEYSIGNLAFTPGFDQTVMAVATRAVQRAVAVTGFGGPLSSLAQEAGSLLARANHPTAHPTVGGLARGVASEGLGIAGAASQTTPVGGAAVAASDSLMAPDPGSDFDDYGPDLARFALHALPAIGLLTEGGAAEEIAGAGRGGKREPPFNPSGSLSNCVNGVCAFLNSVKDGTLRTASADSAWNGGSIRVANEQIAARTGVRFGNSQQNSLDTARTRQFFVVYPGSSPTAATHVMIGINNGGATRLYDPQTGARFSNPAAIGPFIAFPVAY